MKQSAFCLIRPAPAYRRDSFAAGLEAAGYQVHFHAPTRWQAGDTLVIWNRYAQNHQLALRMERAGGQVLIAENGYLGREWRGQHWYALSRNWHNGAGSWAPGDGSRWSSWGVDLANWRERGEHILVLLQRGIGVAPVAQPGDWERKLRAILPHRTDRPIIWRGHPGERHPHSTLYRDLVNAHAVITWASGGALKALVAGVPVFYGLPQWIGAPAGAPFGADLEAPRMGDCRRAMFERLAWAMWNTEELAEGEPFRCLLRTTFRAA